MISVDTTEVDWDTALIILTDEEYTRLRENGRSGTRKLCLHRWCPRRALAPDEVFVLGSKLMATSVGFPGGRVCAKCGRVEVESEAKRTTGDRWTQKELTGGRTMNNG